MFQKIDPILLSKTFYSPDLNIRLLFHEGGGLSGFLQRHPNKGCAVTKQLQGLYARDGFKTQISFFTELTMILTAYSGEILKYEKHQEYLIIKSVAVNDLTPEPDILFRSESLLLLDRPDKDPQALLQRITSDIS